LNATTPRRAETHPAKIAKEVPASVTQLGERIAAMLARAEAALERGGNVDAKELRATLAELRGLLVQQGANAREMSTLSNFLQTHAEREKALLARELHDSLGGILTPAKMDLAWLEIRLGKEPEYAERLRRLGALIDQGIDLKRRVIENLHPSLLDHLGLASALQWYVDDVCRAAGIRCQLAISEKLERLAPDLEIALYRLTQESVANVLKHAQARNLELSLERTDKGLSMVIADDGVGIADLDGAKALSYGLAGMMHRVRSVNGTFDIRSTPERGTRIEVFIPL
jgi:hypothetical protein